MRYLRTVSALCAVLSLGGTASSWAQPEGEPVHVTNFPEVQQIAGRVVVSEPIPQSRFETVKAVVAPVSPADTAQWTEAGVIDTRGFAHLTLSLAGTLQGSAQAGTIGVALVPDVPELLNALRTHGVAPFALRAEAEVTAPLNGFFSSASTAHRLAFPRYRVFLYNTSSKSAEALVYAYLSGA
jgi:hypothetical protein